MLQIYPSNPKSSKKFHCIHEIQTIAANEPYRRGTKRRNCHRPGGGGLYVELFQAVFPVARSVPLHWNRNRLRREIGIRQLDRAAPSLSWLHYNTIFSSWSRGCGPRGVKVEREERHGEERARGPPCASTREYWRTHADYACVCLCACRGIKWTGGSEHNAPYQTKLLRARDFHRSVGGFARYSITHSNDPLQN